MAVVRHLAELAATSGPGWTERACADAAVFGAPVPMRARRYVIDPGAVGPQIRVEAEEAMVYVAAGNGTAEIGDDRYELETETMLWLGSGQQLVLRAGSGGLDALLAQAPG